MTLRLKIRHPGQWHIHNLSIGVRLRLAFACVLALLVLGSSVALWEWRSIAGQVDSVTLVEKRMTAIFQLDNSVLTLMNDLHAAADTRRPEAFEAEATRLLNTLRNDTAWAN